MLHLTWPAQPARSGADARPATLAFCHRARRRKQHAVGIASSHHSLSFLTMFNQFDGAPCRLLHSL